MALLEYKRRPGAKVHAIRLDLETSGFEYVKWGSTQHCKKGDFIVLNADEVYTVDAETFANTYAATGPAEYEKVGTVWAEQAKSAGVIDTKEGKTRYEAGDYVVYNDREQTDGYAVSPAKFEKMYER
jgi:hypothetical protein